MSNFLQCRQTHAVVLQIIIKYKMAQAIKVPLGLFSAYQANSRSIARNIRSLCCLHCVKFLFADKVKELVGHTFLGHGRLLALVSLVLT